MAVYNIYDNRRYIFDGQGGCSRQDTEQSLIWHNFDYKNPQTFQKLLNDYQLDSGLVEALCDDDTRPRLANYENGLMLILRAINLNENADPEDMISLRIWLDNNKIITLQHRNMKSIKKIAEALEEHQGPKNPVQCFLALARLIADTISKNICSLIDRTDDMEEKIIDVQDIDDFAIRNELNDLRHEIINLRRYISPMKDVFLNLQLEKHPMISNHEKITLKEIANDIIKSLEDLDYCRERISFYHEELQSRISVNMNRIMYTISIFTAIFLPLTLLTGLLGINVQGIPYADKPYAFWIVCGLMFLMSLLLIMFMKKRRWM